MTMIKKRRFFLLYPSSDFSRSIYIYRGWGKGVLYSRNVTDKYNFLNICLLLFYYNIFFSFNKSRVYYDGAKEKYPTHDILILNLD